MPLYRQEAEWKRLGLDLSRTTMANWLIIASREYFIPIVNRMHEIFVEEKYLHADETPIQVLNEPGKPATSKSYMWVYSSIRESEASLSEYLNTSLIEKLKIHRSSLRISMAHSFLMDMVATTILRVQSMHTAGHMQEESSMKHFLQI